MLPQHLAPHMKDDVRRETQRLETSFFMRKRYSSIKTEFMEKHDHGGHSNAQGDEYIHNSADLLTNHENWACEL